MCCRLRERQLILDPIGPSGHKQHNVIQSESQLAHRCSTGAPWHPTGSCGSASVAATQHTFLLGLARRSHFFARGMLWGAHDHPTRGPEHMSHRAVRDGARRRAGKSTRKRSFSHSFIMYPSRAPLPTSPGPRSSKSKRALRVSSSKALGQLVWGSAETFTAVRAIVAAPMPVGPDDSMKLRFPISYHNQSLPALLRSALG